MLITLRAWRVKWIVKISELILLVKALIQWHSTFCTETTIWVILYPKTKNAVEIIDFVCPFFKPVAEIVKFLWKTVMCLAKLCQSQRPCRRETVKGKKLIAYNNEAKFNAKRNKLSRNIDMVQLGIQLHSNDKARFTKTAVLKSVMFFIPTSESNLPFTACLESRYLHKLWLPTFVACLNLR